MDQTTGRARPSGIAADIAKKLDGKRSTEQENECLDWMEAVVGETIDRTSPYEDILKDGAILCKYHYSQFPRTDNFRHACHLLNYISTTRNIFMQAWLDISGRRDAGEEQQALDWIASIIGEKLDQGPLEDVLRDGIVLCKLINVLRPNSVKKIHGGSSAFIVMQNIEAFQKGMLDYGVPKEDLFQTVDLWEKKNIPAVTKAIYALGRTAQKNKFAGPVLGPKMADENIRNFDEATLRAGESHIGLQAGYNKGASQAGLNMGKSRAILD